MVDGTDNGLIVLEAGGYIGDDRNVDMTCCCLGISDTDERPVVRVVVVVDGKEDDDEEESG